MSQYEQSNTKPLPSWKMNLTQQFNQASSSYDNNSHNNNNNKLNNKNNKSNNKHTINNFEQQLQQRLTNIIIPTNHHHLYKEQLSSQKSQLQKQRQLQQKINKNNKKDNERNNNNINYTQNCIQLCSGNQYNFNTTNTGKNNNKCYYDSIFTNNKVAELFNKHFGNYNDNFNTQIGLQQFVNILWKEYLGQSKIEQQKKPISQQITNDIKKALVQECRLIFCTTDQHTISLNAIQLLTKKNDLKLIISQLLLQIKYQRRKQKLQLKYEKILQSIIQQQQQIQKQQKKLTNKRIKIQAQQKQIKKIQLKIKLQQKQLVEKQKQIKKFIQEKYNKLSQQLKQVYDKKYKQIQKKANAFQRNAKNKLELIEKRRLAENKSNSSSNNNNSSSKSSNNNNNTNSNTNNNNTNSNTNNNNTNNEQSLTSLTSTNHKLNNQLIIIKSKLKKAQKQLQTIKTTRDKQIKQLQNESNSLLKINTMLQSKLQKSKSKFNQLIQQIVKIQRQLQSYKYEVREKNRQIIKLQEQLLEKQHIVQNIYQQKGQYQQQKRQYYKQKQIKQYQYQDQLQYKQNNIFGLKSLCSKNNNNMKIITITNNINDIVRLLMQAFNNNKDNHNISKISLPSINNINPTINTTTIEIQQALINQSTDIIVTCGNIFWSVVNHVSQSQQSQQLPQQQFHQQINIFNLLQFVIKLFMAKFSFIKFQSLMIFRENINNRLYLGKLQQQLEQFVENVSTAGKGQEFNNYDYFNLTMQQKIKASSIFLSLCQSSVQQQLQQQQQQQNNLYQQKLQTQLNLYIVLLIFGINQTFNFKTCKLQPIIKKILNLLTNLQSSSYKFFNTNNKHKLINKLYDEQLMTFLMWKYMSYGVGINQVSTFMDVLIQLCNVHQQYQQNITTNTNNKLFKTIYALENYKCFINFLLMNFTQKNLSKNNILLKQTLQKVSIILQRFCYCYKGKVNVMQEDQKRLKKMVKQIHMNRQFEDSMFKANMISILQAIEQNNQEDQYNNE